LNGLRRRHRSHNALAGSSEAKPLDEARIVLGHFRKALQFPVKKLKDSLGEMGLPHHAPEAVVHPPATPPSFYESGRPERLQVARDGVLGESQGVNQLTYA
jgi:hypothetical protein